MIFTLHEQRAVHVVDVTTSSYVPGLLFLFFTRAHGTVQDIKAAHILRRIVLCSMCDALLVHTFMKQSRMLVSDLSIIRGLLVRRSAAYNPQRNMSRRTRE